VHVTVVEAMEICRGVVVRVRLDPLVGQKVGDAGENVRQTGIARGIQRV